MEVANEARDVERRLHIISGRVAQLDVSLKTVTADLTAMNESIKRLSREAAALPQGSEERDAAEKCIYKAQLVMQGAGPGGALQGYMKPIANSKFMKLFVGGAVELASMRQESRMRIKEEYYNFRDKMTLLYVALPASLLFLNYRRQQGGSLPNDAGLRDNADTVLKGLFPILLQVYWCFMLYFYTALALRENVLRANGSNIRSWWINHHYWSMGMSVVVLTMNIDSPACSTFMVNFLIFTSLQGVVMLVQNRYQRFRLYTRVAMGKASPMDVAGGELSGNKGQLKLLYPLLFGLQVMQFYFGALVVGVAVTEYRKEGVMMREWQAPACGILFCIMAVGNFQATSATVLHKRNFAKKARMRRDSGNSSTDGSSPATKRND